MGQKTLWTFIGRAIHALWYAYARKILFCEWRVGPMTWNSLSKNMKKWEKNAIKSWKWAIFCQKLEFHWRDFGNKMAIFWLKSGKNSWFSLKNGLNSGIFSQFSSKMGYFQLFLSYFHDIFYKGLLRILIDFHWFWYQIGLDLDKYWLTQGYSVAIKALIINILTGPLGLILFTALHFKPKQRMLIFIPHIKAIPAL